MYKRKKGLTRQVFKAIYIYIHNAPVQSAQGMHRSRGERRDVGQAQQRAKARRDIAERRMKGAECVAICDAILGREKLQCDRACSRRFEFTARHRDEGDACRMRACPSVPSARKGPRAALQVRPFRAQSLWDGECKDVPRSLWPSGRPLSPISLTLVRTGDTGGCCTMGTDQLSEAPAKRQGRTIGE